MPSMPAEASTMSSSLVDTAPAPSARAVPAPRRAVQAPDATHSGWTLAPGETVIWQGRPSGLGLALRAFRLPIVATYFAVLVGAGLVEAQAGRAAIGAALMPFASGLATLAILSGLAWLVARTTTYLVTADRVILRYGVALPRSLSLPFRQIASLSVSCSRGGRGDIAFSLRAGNKPIPYLKLWPHVRPWHLRRPEIMLRDVSEAGSLATRLARELASADAARAARGLGSK